MQRRSRLLHDDPVVLVTQVDEVVPQFMERAIAARKGLTRIIHHGATLRLRSGQAENTENGIHAGFSHSRSGET